MKRFIIAITGASGVCYAKRLFDVLQPQAELHVIVHPLVLRGALHRIGIVHKDPLDKFEIEKPRTVDVLVEHPGRNDRAGGTLGRFLRPGKRRPIGLRKICHC